MIVDTHRQAPTTEPTHSDPDQPQAWWRVWLPVLIAVTLGGGIVAGLIILVGNASADVARHQARVERSTFIDSFGRQCTQIRAGNAIALDCDYKPVESRLGSLLEGGGQ